MRDLIDGEAELNDDEDDESFDEETGETRAKGGNDDMIDDSSDEEEDDEDEEEARRVRWVCAALAIRALLICLSHRSEKVSSLTKTKRKRRPTTRKNVSVVERRSAGDKSGRRKNNLTRRTST
jgi:hypothetical protein